MAIVHYTGDVLQSGAHVIAHQVNCKGVMGAGIALQIRQRYPHVFSAYRSVCRKSTSEDLLGKIQPCLCGGASERWVVNCFAQTGYGTDTVQTDYAALESCMTKLRDWAIFNSHKQIAIPFGIGCGLAGGSWDVVSGILARVFNDNRVVLEIWKLPNNKRTGGYHR